MDHFSGAGARGIAEKPIVAGSAMGRTGTVSVLDVVNRRHQVFPGRAIISRGQRPGAERELNHHQKGRRGPAYSPPG